MKHCDPTLSLKLHRAETSERDTIHHVTLTLYQQLDFGAGS